MEGGGATLGGKMAYRQVGDWPGCTWDEEGDRRQVNSLEDELWAAWTRAAALDGPSQHRLSNPWNSAQRMRQGKGLSG